MTGETACDCCEAESIRHLLKEYGRLLDAKDFAGWAALFAEDGEWIGGDVYGVVTGRETLAAFAAGEFANTPPCVHMLGNMAVEVSGATTATAWSRWLLIEQGADTLVARLAGSYSDQLVKLPEGWRFQRREVTLDLPRLG